MNTSDKELRALIAQARQVLGEGETFSIPRGTSLLTLHKKGPGGGSWEQFAFNVAGIQDNHNRRSWRGSSVNNPRYPLADSDTVLRVIPALLRQGYKVVKGPEWA